MIDGRVSHTSNYRCLPAEDLQQTPIVLNFLFYFSFLPFTNYDRTTSVRRPLCFANVLYFFLSLLLTIKQR